MKEKYTPEQQAKLEKSRTLSDAELLNDLRIPVRPKEKIDFAKKHIEVSGRMGKSEVVIIEEGGKYIIKEGEKRLEVTETQIERAKHEMFKSLSREAQINLALARIGLETIDGLSRYYLSTLMYKKGNVVFEGEAICCSLGHALGWNADIGKYYDPETMQEILESFYAQYPELNNPEKPFVLEGDFGKVAVKGYKMEYIGD